MRIRFDKINEFIRVRGGEFRHLVLFDYGLFDKICDKIKYLTSEGIGITDSINHNSLPIKKILTLYNVIILITSVVNKNKYNYYYNTFLEKGLYKGKSDIRYF